MARNLISSEALIRAIKPGDPRNQISDGDGLFLLLSVKGGVPAWRLDYRFQGKRNTLSLGTYPDTSLALARRKAEAARQLLAEGFDPSQQRKAEKEVWAEKRVAAERVELGLPAVGSFETVAREWFAVRRDGWSKSYGDKVIARLETDVFPYIGRVPAADIPGPQLLEVLRRIEARGVIETAHRALQHSGQVADPGAHRCAGDRRARGRAEPRRGLPGMWCGRLVRRSAADERADGRRVQPPGCPRAAAGQHGRGWADAGAECGRIGRARVSDRDLSGRHSARGGGGVAGVFRELGAASDDGALAGQDAGFRGAE